MQPPPQTVPPGTGGPPPVGGIPRNRYWSNSPYSRRANTPVAPAAGPVQPVTDPFAFGRQTPQGTPLGNQSKGSPLVMQGPSGVFPQPSNTQVPQPHAGDNPLGLHPSLPGPPSQPGVNTDLFTNTSAPSALSGWAANSGAEIHPNTEPGPRNPSVPSHYSSGPGLENSYGGYPQGSVPPPGRPLSRQDPSAPSSGAPTTSSFFPPPLQQTAAQWRPVQGSPPPSLHNYPPFAELPSHSTAPLAPGMSHFHPGAGHQQYVPPVTVSGPPGGGEKREPASDHHPENRFSQTPGATAPWVSQPYPEQFYPPQHLADPSLANPVAQVNSSENQPQYGTEAVLGHGQPEAPSGTFSVFFARGEAKNEENLSLGIAGKSDFDGFPPSSGPGYPHPPHPPQLGAAGLPQAAVVQGSPSEDVQRVVDAPPYFSQPASNQHDTHTAKNTDLYADDRSGVGAAHGSQFENIENLECVQNQEVPPSEPPNLPASSPNELYRYGPATGQPLPKHSVGSHAEGGSNLESPDALPHPIRSESVSSNYSGVSHRSAASSARPQELVGTFIQQEVGKPDEELSGSFFKQIDSSPLGGEICEPSVHKSYHGNLSQPPTPSPPKPTGVFQTSANSSFEPVRAHGVGVKPVEADRANVVAELRENPGTQKNSRPSPALPAASPGNLEQPPDNMETFFMPHGHPLPRPGDPGSLLPHIGGPPLENTPLSSEKRASTRAHAKKCESPATTLWAQNELPNFGGNVLLAPAAPALYVPPKTQASEVIQPPDEGLSHQQARKPGSVPVRPPTDGSVSSENLENPPKMGEEEALPSQASSGYASLLSSPPTESLQNQPILIAQPNQSYNLAQPKNISMPLPNRLNPPENNQSQKDPPVADRSTSGSHVLRRSGSGESVPLPGSLNLPVSAGLSKTPFSQGPGTSPEMASNQPTNLLVQPPLNLVPEGQKNQTPENLLPEYASKTVNLPSSPGTRFPPGNSGVMLVPPVSSTLVPQNNPADHSGNRKDISEALDYAVTRTMENQMINNSVHNPASAGNPAFSQKAAAANHAAPSGPEARDKEHFYQQVTKDPRRQTALDGTQQGALAPPQQIAGAPGPKAVPSGQPSDPSHPGSQPGVETPPGSSAPPAGYGPTAAGRPQLPPGTGAPAPAVNAGQPSGQQEPPRPPPSQTPQNAFGPPQNLPPYYYYRHPYEAYQPPYPQPYPTDPRLAPHLYQEDAYGLYDPRYRHYDSGTEYPESYRYAEPERPSSRASHSSERPSSRQGYPERYYNTKGGWSSQSDFYANYYSSQYDYGDPSRWERYQYDPRYRDSRYDRRYWYDSEHDPYRKEPYYDDRPEKYEDHWRYDPRFTGSFDDEPEPHRDPYGDELDRRSVHSEHSAHSQQSSHSRQSSFSSRSRQSQIYRNHDVTANSYDATAQPGSHHGDYSYGYSNHFKDAQTFVDYGYPSETGWSATEHVPSRPSTPEKFSVTHVCARFGPGGHLIKVLPNLPSEGQPALVEIHSMETMLQHTPEQEEMRSFPGPLAKDDTHKVDVINFAQNKATECFRNENLLDKESASLLWDFIVLLCRQNGTVVGTDIAELLLRDHKTVWLPGKSPNEANLIDFSNEAVEQAEEEEAGEAQLSFLTDSLVTTTDSFEKETERFRELLLYGRKKDALESAMKHGLWGHALLLASKMDNRTHARVMTRFANSLPINDPLQTVYQLMSGRMPAASTCCGDEKWGDWRPHLAMVLSNLNNNMDVESRTIATMGDTLASKGLLDAAHFCYLMAQVGFGVYTKKTTKLVLIGSNHSWPFLKFASNEAIHRTEAYEYAQSLGSQPCFLPNFQVFKFIYACRLAEAGLAAQAFHYCEVISKTILQQPHQYSPVLISQLIQIASQLRLFDPQIKEKPEQESFIEPAWLVQLQHLQGQIKEGDIIWNPDRGTPQQYPSTPSSELEHYDGPGLAQDMDAGAGNPLLASLLPNLEPPNQNVRLMPSAPQTILDGSAGVAPPLQQENSSSVPFYPGPPSMRPVPGYSPPGSVPGFSDQYGGEPGAVYLGPDGLPGGQSSHAAEQLPEESRSQDPATRRMPQESPIRSTFPDQREDDFSGKLAPGRRSRTTSQSSVHLGQGRRPQNSESLGHSAGKQPSPSASVPDGKRPAKEVKKDIKEPKKGGESWFSRWLPGKKKTEAYLPDDKNKSIVWDEKKQRWVNLDEPEEMSKPPPPPPTSFPKVPQALPPGPAGPPNASVNMFSRKAGSRARYVDVLNPSGTKPSAPVPAPSDLFAPLAPLPIPSNLFVPNPEEQPPVESGSLEGQTSPVLQTNPEAAAGAQLVNSAASPPGCELPASNLDGSQSGELSRCSSMSSLSREVSQHFNQPACSLPLSGGPPAGTVPFYNPSQFAQPSVAPGSTRLGRIGQRKYPSLK
ncbi:protein transport protein Sec16A isoform X2 [Ornithorhynchus anatinus]|uniref:protein transport protein Sec16A isoform X2 n=1 Tax=Ornithorhynchus anatinus TaxID=9258 RepID=UPI0019D4A510|nr:protein transport protein Sec16A isoform X2 [Ornithorhynchus anatinus]